MLKPEILVGVAGAASTFIVTEEAVELPHALLAVTVIFPPVELAVVVIEFVVEVPVHPEGNVQV